jgi:hypothetical protein
MAIDDIWQATVELTNRAFQVISGVDLPRGNHWLALVTVSLALGNERLDSVRLLLSKNYRDSAVILTRSLFELAVNLTYIAKDVPRRLPAYLRHGRIPITKEEAQKLREELKGNTELDVKNIVPTRTWKPLRNMCCDLGSDWLREFETFYPYVSVPTHAGAFTFGKDYLRLLEQKPPSDTEKATVLITALDFQFRVAEVAAGVFPLKIKLETVRKLRSECGSLGQSLAKR